MTNDNTDIMNGHDQKITLFGHKQNAIPIGNFIPTRMVKVLHLMKLSNRLPTLFRMVKWKKNNIVALPEVTRSSHHVGHSWFGTETKKAHKQINKSI